MKVGQKPGFLTAEGGGATFSLTLEPETFTLKPVATDNLLLIASGYHAKTQRPQRKNVEQPLSAVGAKVWCVGRTLHGVFFPTLALC
jgi:hypothetical protein